ncbi:hypothetical protein MHBO_002001 [Bonamia ostreae]|uniref:Proteasome alpha-type subunits domain-containing protein n=1 Tax=Bonamia ostreae TaxID=126728 RepID=A0ABV2ALN9_9EUKA
MSRRFDRRTTEFSPEGRIHQLENAMEAISKGGAGVAILTKDGVVFAAERRITSKLIDFKTESEKMYRLDKHITCLVAGLQADANTLIDFARRASQNYRYTYQDDTPVEHLVKRVCDLKHSYTQFGGYRPFGASFLVGGYDQQHGFQLYETDPSGNYAGWKAVAIGSNSAAATGVLKKHFNAEFSLEKAKELALRALCRALDVTETPLDKVEIGQICKNAENDVKWTVLGPDEVRNLALRAEKSYDFGEE